MTDIRDDLIETLVRARECALSPADLHALVKDVFDAPWSDRPSLTERPTPGRRWRTIKPEVRRGVCAVELETVA